MKCSLTAPHVLYYSTEMGLLNNLQRLRSQKLNENLPSLQLLNIEAMLKSLPSDREYYVVIVNDLTFGSMQTLLRRTDIEPWAEDVYARYHPTLVLGSGRQVHMTADLKQVLLYRDLTGNYRQVDTIPTNVTVSVLGGVYARLPMSLADLDRICIYNMHDEPVEEMHFQMPYGEKLDVPLSVSAKWGAEFTITRTEVHNGIALEFKPCVRHSLKLPVDSVQSIAMTGELV